MKKTELQLSKNTRKALCVQLGDRAGLEIATLLQTLADRVEQLERGKVSVTPVAPANSVNLLASVADQLT